MATSVPGKREITKPKFLEHVETGGEMATRYRVFS